MERALTGLARLTKGKSMKDLSSMERKEYPPDPTAYELLDDCGRGVSATVHRALCKPLHDIIAIKKMNLESLNCDLDEIIHEAQIMKNYNHPNVLPLHTSFVNGSELWMVMPFVSGGSVLHIMKYAHPEGLEEVVIATIMRDVLRALDYVHKQGGIHRDIKAGNILIDKDGHVQLGDFGVAANLERSGSWGHDKVVRNTFVGTPCWMAPEVMEQTQGYGSPADIWSFGITLLEMAHGHAPFAKFPPMKVLLMTLQNPPPTLDDKGKKHFSKAMRDVVTRCLQKEPKLRPTAAQLLEHKFFKQARDDEYLARNLMAGLPPLGERVLEIRQGRAATNAQDNDANFARSQDEYKKGISSWNFDVAALKAQAALEPDDDEPPLPTINEMDEMVEGTLSGIAANEVAAMVHMQRSGVPSPPSQSQQPVLPAAPAPTANGNSQPPLNTNSVFALLPSQQQLLNGSMSTSGFAGEGNGASSSGAAPAESIQSERPTPTYAAVAAQQQPPAAEGYGGSSLSPPGAASPAAGLSREGSVQGPLSNLASTPTASKQKTKTLGRFQIYEPGSEPPPMSPVAQLSGAVVPPNAPSGMLEVSNSSRSHATVDTARTSEDGKKLELQQAGGMQPQESVFDDTLSVEPKKKGRFLVVEQSGLIKAPSTVNLVDANMASGKARSDGGKDPLGKPPTPPTPNASTLPVTVVLPKLQELMEHAAQQHAALQRLVGAVQEAEKGRMPLLLSRTLSTRSLFLDAGRAASSVGGTAADEPEAEAARSAVELLRSRLADVETENARLRQRNLQLEAMLASTAAAAATSQQQQVVDGLRYTAHSVAVSNPGIDMSGTTSPTAPPPSSSGVMSPTASPRTDAPQLL